MAKQPRYTHFNDGRHRICHWHGCEEAGDFRAPKTRAHIGSNNASDYLYFCEEHIGLYNRNWDFFSGMSQQEIELFQMDAMHGHRPTWETSQRIGRHHFTEEQLRRAFARFQQTREEFLHKKTSSQHTASATPRDVLDALAALDLPADADHAQIRMQYKILVKRLHPDVNNGDKSSEERFKVVTAAYQRLKEYYTKESQVTA